MLRSALKYCIGMCTVHNNDDATAITTWKAQLGLCAYCSGLLAALLMGECAFLFTAYDSKSGLHPPFQISYCNAHGPHSYICGIWFPKQPTACPLSDHPGWLTLVRLAFQIRKVSCFLYIKLEMQQSYFKQVFTTFKMYTNLAQKKES